MKVVPALLLLFAAAAFADSVHVEPLGPTTATPIEVHYLTSCARRGHTVTRDGSLIRIVATPPNCELELPEGLAVAKVRLPELLPRGEYEVELRPNANEVLRTKFVVRDLGPKPFEIHPSAVNEFDTSIRLRLEGVTCDQPGCSDITVRVDGEVVGPLTVEDDGAITFFAPPHDVGFADVSVTKSDFTSVSPGALYFFGGDEDPSGVFEPVLLPVLFSADGAYGSKWRSEAVISNPTPWELDFATPVLPIGPCIGYPCNVRVQPKQFIWLSDRYPQGKLMLAPRAEASRLAFSLRVRDISREAEGMGTRVPVVRERDFVHGSPIELLDVPFDPRHRVKLRIYMIEPVIAEDLFGTVLVHIGDGLLGSRFQLTRRPGPVGGTTGVPYYAEVDLPPPFDVAARLKVEIRMPVDAVAWAFATVTNNETQQVTIVTPQ